GRARLLTGVEVVGVPAIDFLAVRLGFGFLSALYRVVDEDEIAALPGNSTSDTDCTHSPTRNSFPIEDCGSIFTKRCMRCHDASTLPGELFGKRAVVRADDDSFGRVTFQPPGRVAYRRHLALTVTRRQEEHEFAQVAARNAV